MWRSLKGDGREHTFRIHPLRVQIGKHGLIALLLQALGRLLIHQTTAPPPPSLVFGIQRHLALGALHHRRRRRRILFHDGVHGLRRGGRGAGGGTGLRAFGKRQPGVAVEERGGQFGGLGAASAAAGFAGGGSEGAEDGGRGGEEVENRQFDGRRRPGRWRGGARVVLARCSCKLS